MTPAKQKTSPARGSFTNSIMMSIKPLLKTGVLATAFALPATLNATGRHTRHVQKAKLAAMPPTIDPAELRDALVYHVQTGQLDFGDHFYDASSGNRAGFNNSRYQKTRGTGPVPVGIYKVVPREAPFFDEEAWRILHTPKRTNILIHTDDVHLRNRPIGETKGCIAVNSDQWKDFKDEMHRVQPGWIVVLP